LIACSALEKQVFVKESCIYWRKMGRCKRWNGLWCSR